MVISSNSIISSYKRSVSLSWATSLEFGMLICATFRTCINSVNLGLCNMFYAMMVFTACISNNVHEILSVSKHTYHIWRRKHSNSEIDQRVTQIGVGSRSATRRSGYLWWAPSSARTASAATPAQPAARTRRAGARRSPSSARAGARPSRTRRTAPPHPAPPRTTYHRPPIYRRVHALAPCACAYTRTRTRLLVIYTYLYLTKRTQLDMLYDLLKKIVKTTWWKYNIFIDSDYTNTLTILSKHSKRKSQNA